MKIPPGWALAAFAAALVARLAFLALADQPLLYTHQYHYFTSALRIAEHPDPLGYVVTSDEWRTWNHHWTIAPLYHLFAAGVFLLFGPHLLPLRLLQCLLDALAAVGVAALGRRAAGPAGWWAGIAYALYWPAVEVPTWTMTENLHTVLLVGGAALLAAGRRPLLAGVLLGLGALTRSVTTGFLGLAVLWLLLRRADATDAAAAAARGWPARVRAGLRPAALLALGGALVIAPWTARNVFIIGEPVLIETAAFENIWYANHFGDPAQFARQQQVVHGQPTPEAKRAAALHFALRGLRRHPERLLEKVRVNFWHFLRPEGLHNLVRVERSQERWRHLGSLLLDDPLLLASLAPLLVFLVAGRPGAARSLIRIWLAYYLLMVVVVFHNEIRYRSAFVPFAFAGAAGGVAVLLGTARRRPVVMAASAAGLLLALALVWPFTGPGLRGLSARRKLGSALDAAGRGHLAAAWPAAQQAAAHAPGSARPWFDFGRALAGASSEGALAAYDRGRPLATAMNWRGTVARPRLLAAAGRTSEAATALAAAHRLSWDADPWLVLEVAWRELPAPRTSRIEVGGDDYGAVRGFLHPRGEHGQGAHRLEWNRYHETAGPVPPPGTYRWSRGRAWLRLVPEERAAAYDVTLYMGAPFPSPLESPRVTVRATGGTPSVFTLTPLVSVYTVRAAPAPGEPVLVEIEAPTWNRAGEPAEQGVRVEKMEVRPAAGGQSGG